MRWTKRTRSSGLPLRKSGRYKPRKFLILSFLRITVCITYFVRAISSPFWNGSRISLANSIVQNPTNRVTFQSFFQKKELNTGKLTVGKIYGGLLILENWKTTRFGQIEASASTVCLVWAFDSFFFHYYYLFIFVGHLLTNTGPIFLANV